MPIPADILSHPIDSLRAVFHYVNLTPAWWRRFSETEPSERASMLVWELLCAPHASSASARRPMLGESDRGFFGERPRSAQMHS